MLTRVHWQLYHHVMRKDSGERKLHQRQVTANLAGLTEEQLADISPIIGGSHREITGEVPENMLDIGTVILPWGDERLATLLADVTEASVYPYGAERLHFVVITARRAIWFLVVPKVPYDIDDARDDTGEIDGTILALMDPQMDPNAIFYTWDSMGREEIEQYHKYAQGGSRPWIDAGDYLLAFELSIEL